MKKLTISIFLIFLFISFSSCTSRASGVAPVAVSIMEYQDLSCEETKALLAQKREEENALTQAQDNAATGDGVGGFLLLIRVGSLTGNDVSGDLALANGEVNALERAVPVNCKKD